MSSGGCISSIRVSTISRDLGGRVWNPAILWTVKHAVYVEISLDNGQTGLGECWCFDTAPDSLVAYLRTEVLPAMIGLSPDKAFAMMTVQRQRATLTARHGMLASAHSAVDLALWDLKAQSVNMPLWQALDPAGRGYAFVYASGGLYAQNKDPNALSDEIQGFADRGFHAVKMKVGGMPAFDDAARVLAVRDRIGQDVGLMIDGVSSYDAETALAFFDLIRHADIMAFQAPIPPADLCGLRRLCHEGVPVMVGEAEYRDEIFAELLNSTATTILQVAPVACGGPSRVRALARMCTDAGITLSLETSSTAVATLSALHLAAALPVIGHVEVHQIHDVLFREAGITDPDQSTGHLAPPDKPGLGFTLQQGATETAFRIGADAAPKPDSTQPNKIAI